MTSSTLLTNIGIISVFQDDTFGFIPLTKCCSAAVTGTTGGVACKGCYRIVPEWFGGSYTKMIDLVAVSN